MKHFTITLLLVFLSLFLIAPTAYAQPEFCDETQEGQCISGGICTKINNPPVVYYAIRGSCEGGNLGKVNPPDAIRKLNLWAGLQNGSGDYSGIGILYFLNRVIILVNVIAGIIVMFNVVTSGWIFLTSWGKPDAFTQVRDKLTLTFIGVAVIAFSYTIAGVLGLIFFQDATAIINPTLCSPNSTDPICSF